MKQKTVESILGNLRSQFGVWLQFSKLSVELLRIDPKLPNLPLNKILELKFVPIWTNLLQFLWCECSPKKEDGFGINRKNEYKLWLGPKTKMMHRWRLQNSLQPHVGVLHRGRRQKTYPWIHSFHRFSKNAFFLREYLFNKIITFKL